jgi:hypothetical protein
VGQGGDSDIDTLLQKLAVRPQQRRPLHLVGTKRFELIRKLGAGGFGDVYEARDREHGTRVALKALRSTDPDWIFRFKREFRVAADLAHPNVVRLFELFVEDERWYLTMELLEGIPLHDYVARAPEKLRACFGQLALGLVELHRAKCLHRDLKPSNVLVEPSGRVVLLDFGLAVNQRAGKLSAIAGTPPYMAPELGLKQPPTELSDWYAFGVMLYEVLAGALPFAGNEVEMLQRKLGPPPSMPKGSGVDDDLTLGTLALRLIDKDPATRAIAEDVFAVLLGETRSGGPRSDVKVVGREAELAVLDDALARVGSSPVVVTVRGMPGMGKSSLLAAFEDRVRARGVAFYAGRCREVESVPFKGLDPVIDLIVGDLVRKRWEVTTALVPRDVAALMQMFPMFKRVEAFVRARNDTVLRGSPLVVRDAALRAFKELVVKLSADAPIVIAIDDLQWAGEDTMRVLGELVRTPGARCLVICAHRDERAAAIELLEKETGAAGVVHRAIEVGALDEQAVTEWLGADGALSVQAALRETGGHPYLLSRMIDFGAGAEPDLVATLSRDLSHLEASARGVLEAIAVAGAPIKASIASDVAGGTADAQATLDHLRRRKLIRRVDHYVEPYHDRVREVVIAETSNERRRALHVGLGGALERSGLVAADVLAAHYTAGGDAANAFTWTRRAATNASTTLAFARAVALYRSAVELAPDDTQRLEVLGQLAEAFMLSGKLVAAADTCVEASELAKLLGDDTAAAVYRAQAGEHSLIGGQQERGFELLRDALTQVDVRLPASAAVAVAESFNIGGALAAHGLDRRPSKSADPKLVRRLDLELAVARALTQTDLRAPLMACRSLDDALTVGDPGRLQRALALFVLNHAARMPGDPLLIDADERARSLALELGDEIGMAWAELASGIHAMYLQDFATALADLAAAERVFVATPGYARESALCRIGAIVVCGNYYVDLPHARVRAAGFLEDALARGDLYTATWAMFVQINVELANGQPAAARKLLDGIHETWPLDRDSMLAANVINHRIALALVDDPATAWREVEATADTYVQLFSSMIPISTMLYNRLTANAAFGAWLAGDADRATTLARLDQCAAKLTQLPLGGGHMVVEAHRHRVRGEITAERIARERSADLYEAGHQHLLAVTCRYRMYQLYGDERAKQMGDELRAVGCTDPDRFATFIAGPLPGRLV